MFQSLFMHGGALIANIEIFNSPVPRGHCSHADLNSFGITKMQASGGLRGAAKIASWTQAQITYNILFWGGGPVAFFHHSDFHALIWLCSHCAKAKNTEGFTWLIPVYSHPSTRMCINLCTLALSPTSLHIHPPLLGCPSSWLQLLVDI